MEHRDGTRIASLVEGLDTAVHRRWQRLYASAPESISRAEVTKPLPTWKWSEPDQTPKAAPACASSPIEWGVVELDDLHSTVRLICGAVQHRHFDTRTGTMEASTRTQWTQTDT